MSFSQLNSFKDSLKNLPPEKQLSATQDFINQIKDPEERYIAETMFFIGQTISSSEQKQHIVVLIHGIRTHAEWQERLAEKLKNEAGIEAFPIGYGYFDVFKFWFPFFTREEPVVRVLREIRTLRSKNPNADISIVAHSFGTYIISRILSNETDVEIHRLQLCGSIISLKYRWDQVDSRISGKAVNDAGTQDIWPVMASLLSWGYGASGAFGFKTVSIKDRFHNCGHSDFFTDEHMRKYWIPLLIDGQIVSSEWSSLRTSRGLFINFLSWLPFKSLLGLYLIYRFVAYNI